MTEAADPPTAPPPDYSVEVKVRNNRILRRVKAAGHSSLKSFCDAHNFCYSTISELTGMKRSAQSKLSGEWKRITVDLAAALNVEPHDLFNERQAAADFERTKVTYEMNEPPRLESVSAPSPHLALEHRDLVAKAREDLSGRQLAVIEARFGLNGTPEQTLDELASQQGVGRERIRQIEKTALRRMGEHLARKKIKALW